MADPETPTPTAPPRVMTEGALLALTSAAGNQVARAFELALAEAMAAGVIDRAIAEVIRKHAAEHWVRLEADRTARRVPVGEPREPT